LSRIKDRRDKSVNPSLARTVSDAGEVLLSVGETVYQWDIPNDQLTWATNAQSLLGVENANKIASDREYSHLLLPDAASSRNAAIFGSDEKDCGDGVYFQIQYGLSAKSLGVEKDVWLEDTGRWFAGENGKPVRAHGIVRVINERRALEERFDRLTRFDDLTGLYNRGYMNECLEVELREAEIENSSMAFVIVALDRFEDINSIYGYDAGDQVIAEVCNRMKISLRGGDTIGRFSGAKLGVVLKKCTEKELRVAGQRFLTNISKDVIETDAGPVAVTASIGGVIMPRFANNVRSASAAAQQALDEARLQRHPRLVAYKPNPELDKMREDQTALAGEVVLAVKENRLQLAYQPIVDANSYRVAFHEALVRMVDSNGVIVPASDFVKVARRLGLIRMVDHQILDLTLDILKRAKSARLSLNVSIETSYDADWLSKLTMAIRRRPDIAARLTIEITESHVSRDIDETCRFIGFLKQLGCKTAIDDFGAGFTTFSNLKKLPVDIIKIDGRFAENLAVSAENRNFIKALVELAKMFGTKTVVEWVDDNDTALLLKSWGVDYLQGYGFGAPVMASPWKLDPPHDDLYETGKDGIMSA